MRTLPHCLASMPHEYYTRPIRFEVLFSQRRRDQRLADYLQDAIPRFLNAHMNGRTRSWLEEFFEEVWDTYDIPIDVREHLELATAQQIAESVSQPHFYVRES